MKTPVQTSDLYAEVQQSTSDKLLGSVSYPFVVFDHRESFPGCSRVLGTDDGAYELTRDEIRELLKQSVAQVRTRGRPSTGESVSEQVYAFGGSILEQAKKTLDVANSSADYEGPDKKELQAVVDGGIEGLVDTLGDFGLYAWNPFLRVKLKNQPKIGLRSPRIDLTGISIEVMATGELWAKYPWWNCYKWCTKWEKVHKCDRVASLTVSPDIAADAHANVEAAGAQVLVTAEFDKLRLEYDILDKIPLEGIANKALKGKTLFVYDASQLIATVPVLQSRFAIDKIVLPQSPNAIGVGVILRQI